MESRAVNGTSGEQEGFWLAHDTHIQSQLHPYTCTGSSKAGIPSCRP